MKSKSKGKSGVTLIFMVLLAIGLCYIAYFGIGPKHIGGIQNIKLGLDLKGGVEVVFEADKEEPTKEEMDSALSLMQERLDQKNYTEAEISQQGKNRIRVDIPGVDGAKEAIETIGKTAQLMFVDEGGKVLLTGTSIKNAVKFVDPNTPGKFGVSLEFTPEGAKLFEDATANNIGKKIIIMLDEAVLSTPEVKTKIPDGQAVIEGKDFTSESAQELANLIEAGSLPFNLEVVRLRNVGARLGAESLETSLMSGAIGFGIILLLMIILYRISGVAADLALFIYISLELIALSIFGITLTLPGIAGIVLSVGMAVDANIIIFERIKDEIEAGRSLRLSTDYGFKRAFPAILDSNVTTIIAGLILFALGTGPIKGFAQTLVIGILLSMFTAIIITRIIVKSIIGVGIDKPKYFGTKGAK